MSRVVKYMASVLYYFQFLRTLKKTAAPKKINLFNNVFYFYAHGQNCNSSFCNPGTGWATTNQGSWSGPTPG